MVGRKNILAGRKLAAAGLLAAAAAGTGFYWKSRMSVPAYTVLRVMDGDTFETTEKQLIRLAHIEAPELDLCGGEDAKDTLEKLVLNKPVYLKVMYRDKYMRLLSLVYTKDGFVNENMARTGNAIYRMDWSATAETKKLARAQEQARSEKAGIYGPECTQDDNPEKPNCNIKGNMREGNDSKIYSYPGCESYARTAVQLYLGDSWFCTEAEARKAGFVKANGCPEK